MCDHDNPNMVATLVLRALPVAYKVGGGARAGLGALSLCSLGGGARPPVLLRLLGRHALFFLLLAVSPLRMTGRDSLELPMMTTFVS